MVNNNFVIMSCILKWMELRPYNNRAFYLIELYMARDTSVICWDT